jgi:hypothetical protein
MESIRRLLTLTMCFLVIAVALVCLVLGFFDLINRIDIKTMEQSFTNYNWNYSR